MSSWFGNASSGPNIHPVQLAHDQDALFGPLTTSDTEWLCTASNFVTETQTWYTTTPSGGLLMSQIIHSAVGLWYPSIQFTFRYFDASKNIAIWKSIPVTNFVTAPSKNLDKRSCKSDQFTVTVDPAKPNVYTIQGKYDQELDISITLEALAEGWKVGAGPRGGMTYFGQAQKPSTKPGPDYTGGYDGYAVHRFWPRCEVKGVVRNGSDVTDLEGSKGMFVHAIQGMRPNVLAAKWNFANFQSLGNDGVSLVQMEFETTPAYGSKKINVGSVVVGDKLVAVTAGGSGVEDGIGSKADHQDKVKDVETDYEAPGRIVYSWQGTKIEGSAPVKGSKVNALIEIDLLTNKDDKTKYETRGLVEKVDVLGQIPYLVKKFVNYAAGTKPYIYTWHNQIKAVVKVPGSDDLTVDGWLFNEATFIS